ncbi:hypothetical protein GGX14DRAFT_398381 [Mycena pura]|uniref:KOW domain-containing protein n=1 Tax=Mycena pura TaxID=153505 RepID=A0AAD6VA94_9AGAR|nr:hypothetical protein GGX14DRAFT_398381 [Mycena pura]
MSTYAHFDANADSSIFATPIPVDHSLRSETLEPAPKRQRLEKSKLSPKKSHKHIEGYFDLNAEDGDEGQSQGICDDEDEEDSETLSDLEFIDDEPVHDEPVYEPEMHLVEKDDHEELQAIAASYSQPRGKDDAATVTGYIDPRLSYLFVQPPDDNRPVMTTAAATAILKQVTGPKWKFKSSMIVPGEWIHLKYPPYSGSLAFVVSSTRVLVARNPETEEAQVDPCMGVEFPHPLESSEFPCVSPTDDELMPFRLSKDRRLRSATFVGSCLALAEGDRIVVVKGEHNGFLGYIIILREVPVNNQCIRYAKVRAAYNGTDVVRKDSGGIFVPISHLRRHALDGPARIRVMDRVRVVSGMMHRGYIGRVTEIENNMLAIQLATGSQINAELRFVARHFQNGDYVQATRGPFKDRKGLIIMVCTGGALELFEGASENEAKVKQNIDRLIRKVQMKVSDLLRIDHEAEENLKALKAMHTGRRFFGMEVQVAWQGPLKGTRGVVVDEHNGVKGIIASVRKEASNQMFDISVKELVHLHTQLPLEQARFLSDAVLKSFRIYSIRQATGICCREGELNGEWLCIPGLANKRVDVRLEGLLSFDHRKMRTTPRIRALEGQSGYLLLNDAITKTTLANEKIQVRAVGGGATAQGIPGPCIRPSRQINRDTSITQVVGRVDIIGPDVTGDTSRIGFYAQTDPVHTHQYGTDAVAVKFERQAAGEPWEWGFFNRVSLCRAQNISIPTVHGEFPATNFD